MSEMAPEQGGAPGNILTGRIMGVPGVVWLIGAAVLAYLLFARKSAASAGSPSTSGGGGEITTGNTTIDTGAVQVSVSQTGPSDSSNPQPSPTVPPRVSTGSRPPIVFGGNTKSKSYTAPGGKDLNKIAQSLHIPEQQLVAFNPVLRQYVGTGKAIPKGTKMQIPVKA